MNGRLSGENLLKQKNMNRKIRHKTTKQVVIDTGLHQLLKVDTAKQGETIRERLERYIYEGFSRD